MGKKKSPKMAPLPDMAALEAKQLATGRENILNQTTANRANQNNQFGSVNWSRDPTSGQWTQTESYNPEQQALLDQQIANQGQMGKMAGGLLGGADLGYGKAPAAGQVGGFNQQATDLYNQLAASGLQRQRSGKEAQMAAMGLNLGSGRAWDAEQENLNRSEDLSGMMGAQAGIAQGNTMFGQQNQLRQNYINEQNQMLQNAGGMMAGAAPEDLQFGSYSQEGLVGTPDYIGNAMGLHQLQQAQNNAKAASKSGGGLGGFLSGVAPIAGAFAGGFGQSMGSSFFPPTK